MTEWKDLSPAEKKLGMDRPITRRHFLDGVAVGIGAIAASGTIASFLAACGSGDKGADWAREDYLSRSSPEYYPPSLEGLRGQYETSNAIPHAIRDGQFWDQAGKVEKTGQHYDLVVVGSGASGLTAALRFRQQAGPEAKILILEVLDDFGGHAKRNEFKTPDGRTMIGYGGSQSIDGPSGFSPEVRQVLSDIGVETRRFEPKSDGGRGYFDQDFEEDHGFEGKEWNYFDRESFGRDALVETAEDASPEEFARKLPLPRKARQDYVDLMTKDYFPNADTEEKRDRLIDMTYEEFLKKVAKVHPKMIEFLHKLPADEWSYGIESISALDAAAQGFPVGTNVDAGDDPRLSKLQNRTGNSDPYIFHFPEGNAGVARLLVRALIPESMPDVEPAGRGSRTMEQEVTARLRYETLDRDGSNTRIRLGSPVVKVRHTGKPIEKSPVEVVYVRDSKQLESVTADHCVMATAHTMMQYLIEGLPKRQKTAMADNVRACLMYTNVLIRNRDAFRKMKTSSVYYPGQAMIFDTVMLDYPVSMGKYRFDVKEKNGDDPAILHLQSFFYTPGSGQDPRSQARAGRARFFAMSFRELERGLRDQLARGLGPAGFDPAEDILAITMNRWGHGYAYEYRRPWDAFWPDGPLPCETARERFGRIAIATSDAGATAYLDEAIRQGVRAAGDLEQLPALN